MCNHENNVLSWLSAQWLCGNPCTLAHDVCDGYISIDIYLYIYNIY